MKTIGEIILEKLTTIENRMCAMEASINKLQQEAFLAEQYTVTPTQLTSQPQPVIVSGDFPDNSDQYISKPDRRGRKKGSKNPKASQLPPSLARDLIADKNLAPATVTYYEAMLRNIVNDKSAFKTVIRYRNEGMLTKLIPANIPLGSRFKDPRIISNTITVARRYGLTELVAGQYKLTHKFNNL